MNRTNPEELLDEADLMILKKEIDDEYEYARQLAKDGWIEEARNAYERARALKAIYENLGFKILQRRRGEKE